MARGTIGGRFVGGYAQVSSWGHLGRSQYGPWLLRGVSGGTAGPGLREKRRRKEEIMRRKPKSGARGEAKEKEKEAKEGPGSRMVEC